MAQQGHNNIEAEAIEWHVRLQGAGPREWDAFIAWLEADPARSDAYDKVKFADAAIGPAMIPIVPAPAANDPEVANENAPRGRMKLWATAFAAVAAIFLVTLVALPWLTTGSDRYEIATVAGERRTVPIGEGSSAVLNGASRLILDRNDPRYAELAAGEATFTVRHDSAQPFLVVAGDHRVQDVGTAFNLVHDRGQFTVEVIEGAVVYDPDGTPVTLNEGQTLRVRNGASPLVGRKETTAMASWQRGQLSYNEIPLETVVGDLARNLGTEIGLDPDLTTLPFTGSIRIDENPAVSVQTLSATLGLQARRDGNRWLIEPHARAHH